MFTVKEWGIENQTVENRKHSGKSVSGSKIGEWQRKDVWMDLWMEFSGRPVGLGEMMRN
jgi:hypothetical protein